MRFTIFLSGILCWVLLVIPSVDAQCAVYRPTVVKSTYTPTVVTTSSYDTVLVTPLVAQVVPIFVPTYGAGYIPPPQTPVQPIVGGGVQQSNMPNPNQEILDLLRKMDARISRLEGNQGGSSLPPPKQDTPNPMDKPLGSNQPNGLDDKVVIANCAACHDALVSKTKGGDIRLSSNGIVDRWDADLSLRVLRAVNDGSMPKGARLTEEDGLKIVNFSLRKRN